jgi:hypothetical protein
LQCTPQTRKLSNLVIVQSGGVGANPDIHPGAPERTHNGHELRVDRRFPSGEGDPLDPAAGQARDHRVDHLGQRHPPADPGGGHEAMSAPHIAVLVDLHQRLAVRGIHRGPEVAGPGQTLLGDAAGFNHRETSPSLRAPSERKPLTKCSLEHYRD